MCTHQRKALVARVEDVPADPQLIRGRPLGRKRWIGLGGRYVLPYKVGKCAFGEDEPSIRDTPPVRVVLEPAAVRLEVGVGDVLEGHGK